MKKWWLASVAIVVVVAGCSADTPVKVEYIGFCSAITEVQTRQSQRAESVVNTFEGADNALKDLQTEIGHKADWTAYLNSASAYRVRSEMALVFGHCIATAENTQALEALAGGFWQATAPAAKDAKVAVDRKALRDARDSLQQVREGLVPQCSRFRLEQSPVVLRAEMEKLRPMLQATKAGGEQLSSVCAQLTSTK